MNVQKYMSQLMERLDDVFFIMEYPAMKFRYVNPGVISRGYTLEEAYASPGIIYRDLKEEQKDKLYAHIKESIGKGPIVLEYELETKNLEKKWCSDAMMVLTDEDGEQLLVGIGRDITIRMNALKELDRLKSDYEDLYNNAPNGLHSLDSNGRIIRINDTELHWLGYKREELLGQHAKTIYAPTSHEKFDETFPGAFKIGFLKDFRIELLRKNGSILQCLLNATVYKDENQQPLFTRTILTDISQLTATENKLKESQEALEASNAELQLANKRLERLNFTKDVLLKIISHDLRNPLETVKMISGLLSDKYEELDTGTLLKYLDYISKSSHHATDILDNMTGILDLDNEVNFMLKKTPIISIIEESMAINLDRAKEKEIALVFEKPEEMESWMANMDKMWMTRALDNLIVNALKFTHSGGEVKIGCRKEGPYISIWVADTGIGIPSDVLPSLFSEFIKNSRPGTKGELGTGMGLSIVKKIVELHHGEIFVESIEGKGSRFEIRLEAVDAAEGQ